MVGERRQAPDGQWQELRGDGYWYPVGTPWPAATAIPMAPNATTVPAGAWMAIIAGIIMGVSALLPWLSASAFGQSINRNAFQLGNNYGFSIDGIVAIFLGVVTVVIGIVRLTNSRPPPFLQRSPIITGVFAILVCVNRYSGINNVAKHVVQVSNGEVSDSISYGFWLLGVAGLIAIVSGLILRSQPPAIPIPVPTIATAPSPAKGVPSGWYPDPGNTQLLRWWDGQRWSEETRSRTP